MAVSGARYRGGPHYRRTRTKAKPIVARSYWVFIAAGAGAIVFSGAVLGAFVIGTFTSNPPQSAASGVPQAPPGVSFVLAKANPVNGTSIPAAGACTTSNLGTLGTPTALTDAGTVGICLNAPVAGFTAGDIMYDFEINWGTSAAPSTIFEVQLGIDIVPSANDVVATSYVETSATLATGDNAVFAVDMTAAGDTSLTSYTILVTQL